jgi:hypothetical protein
MKIRLNKIASSTRTANIHEEVVVGGPIPAEQGTVLAVRVLDTKTVYNTLEDEHGRTIPVHAGDLVAGVLGAREALRGYAGRIPEKVEKGDILHLLNMGGVIGECTSVNPDVGPPCRVEVLGAVMTFPKLGHRVGVPANIFPGTVPLVDKLPANVPPTLFVAGTCMHAGKTSAASILIREATRRGLKVGAAKVTGVALRRDALEMRDHGAVEAITFADVGYSSTANMHVANIAKSCIAQLAEQPLDMIVLELGDGIMGSYGVDSVLFDEELKNIPKALMMAANDPVGAWGAVKWLEERDWLPTLITGPATDNESGSRAIRELTGVPAVNARTQAKELTDTVLTAFRGAL